MFRILVIDDDPFIRLLLGKALSGQGYAISVAESGEAGLAMAKELCPALIICDWLLPSMTGLEVCQKVKSTPELANIYFILLTARTSVEDRVRGLDTGADDFLAKPIEPIELKARVRAALRLHQSNLELQQLALDLQTQKQQLETEMIEAADYVRSLLPKPLQDGIQIQSQFRPSSQLGGDCYDYFWLDPDYLVIYLLDVSGHGLGAALLSVSVQNVLRSQSLSGANFYQPASVLNALNDVFQIDNINHRYFTIWYGVYNRKRHKLTYASAGHPPAILLSSTPEPHLQRLKTPGVPIGLLPDRRFTSNTCDISPGSYLYLFSDGLYEIKQTESEAWGLDAFVEVLTNCQTCQCQPSHIVETVQALNQIQAFEDDCSLLQIKFT